MKHYILSGEQSKYIDNYCIHEMEIPSVVLMERAALSVAGLIENEFGSREGGKKPNIMVVCHTGNNGADGLAAARILNDRGYSVNVFIIGMPEKGTKEFHIQLAIINHTDIQIEYVQEKTIDFTGYDVIVDGIFGIGLSRNVQGIYADIMDGINQSECKVVSIDIPSGLNSDTGQPMGTAVIADHTVTFGNLKLGHKVSQGRDYCGAVHVTDIGFRKEAYEQLFKQENIRYTRSVDLSGNPICFEGQKVSGLPVRKQASNKGTYGKVAVIAGLGGMPGAAYFSAKAAYQCGSGLVKVITTKENTSILKSMLPEAIYADIDEMEDIQAGIRKLVSDCRALVIGPGLGREDLAIQAVTVSMELKLPIVIDADALNILGVHRELLRKIKDNIIVTPHIMEMSRLMGMERSEIMKDIVKAAEGFVQIYGGICILKDSSTVVSYMAGDRIQTYVNITGNSGMATGGSGDVLSGILGGLLAQQTELWNAAELGVYLHGIAGDLAAAEKTEYSVMASDILAAIPGAAAQIMKESVETADLLNRKEI